MDPKENFILLLLSDNLMAPSCLLIYKSIYPSFDIFNLITVNTRIINVRIIEIAPAYPIWFCIPENETLFKRNSAQVDIVSPNLREARILTGLDDPVEAIGKLKDFGAQIAVLRMAEAGSLVLDQHGHLFRVPAFPVRKIIDVTGAGNAFCGGFVVGYAKNGDAREAGWHGAISASLALHQFGALYPLDHLKQEAETRQNWYQEHAKQV